MNLEEQIERQEKIAYARMLEMKRQKNGEVVVMREGNIVRVKP